MVVTVFSKHASLDVQLFRFNLTGMCRSACVGMCAGAHVCLHNDHSPMPQLLGALSVPAVIPCWGTAHTHTHATPTLSHVTPSPFQHSTVNSVLLCLPAWQSDVRQPREERVCWHSPVWSLCSLPSDGLCSQATPLVARWTLRDTRTTNPKGAFTGLHQRDKARFAPLNAFKLIFVSLTAFFYLSWVLHAAFHMQFGLFPTLAVHLKALKLCFFQTVS